ELIRRSSIALNEDPTLRRIMDDRISWMPEKDRLPLRSRRESASDVSFWRRIISDNLLLGSKPSHSSLPRLEPAISHSLLMILSYSRVRNAFSFIVLSLSGYIFFFYFTLVCVKLKH